MQPNVIIWMLYLRTAVWF